MQTPARGNYLESGTSAMYSGNRYVGKGLRYAVALRWSLEQLCPTFRLRIASSAQWRLWNAGTPIYEDGVRISCGVQNSAEKFDTRKSNFSRDAHWNHRCTAQRDQ